MVQAIHVSANRSLHCQSTPYNKVKFSGLFEQRLFNDLNSDPEFSDGFIGATYQLAEPHPEVLYSMLTSFRDFWPKFSDTTKKNIEQQLAKYTHKLLNSEPIE